MKKSIELADPSTIVQTTKNIRWLQIAAPYVVSLLVGTMLGAMLGGLFYGNNADPTSGDFKFVLSQSLGILAGLVAGYLWSQQVAHSGPPEEVVTIGMSMLRKYHTDHAKTGQDAEAAQYKLGAEYLKTLKVGK